MGGFSPSLDGPEDTIQFTLVTVISLARHSPTYDTEIYDINVRRGARVPFDKITSTHPDHLQSQRQAGSASVRPRLQNNDNGMVA